MIRTLLATTAIAAFLSTGALAANDMAKPADSTATAAQPANPPGMKSADEVKAEPAAQMNGHLASNIIGQSVYNSAGKDGKNIGDVNDLVIGKDGKVVSVVVGVGGFLGIGEKNVAIDYSQVDWQQRKGAWWIIVPTTAKELKGLPDFDSSSYKPAPAVANDTDADSSAGGMAPATTGAAGTTTGMNAPATKSDDAAMDNSAAKTDNTAEADTDSKSSTQAMSTDKSADADTSASSDTDKSTTAAIDRSKLNKVDTSTISANDFIGTTVYGADNADIGEINDVVLNKDGKVDAVIIGVGGFLGMGEKSVAVGMDNLAFLADDSGNKYLYTQFTEDQLKAQPAYDKSTYAQNRDKMRMTVQ